MINKLKDFYFKYSPAFTERYLKNNIMFLFSKYVKDEFSNIAIINNISDTKIADTEFKQRKLDSVYYSFQEIKGLKEIYTDDFLFYQNINTLFNKFSKFKSKDVELVKVDSQKLINDYMIINDKCYSVEAYDNPYSNLDNFGYCKSVIDYQKNETESKTLIYIIKFKNIDVGCINLTIKDDLCYVSGLAILKEYRRTKVFSALIDVLEILIKNNVKDVFCVTELGDYPDKLYKKIGFKSIAIAHAYKQK